MSPSLNSQPHKVTKPHSLSLSLVRTKPPFHLLSPFFFSQSPIYHLQIFLNPLSFAQNQAPIPISIETQISISISLATQSQQPWIEGEEETQQPFIAYYSSSSQSPTLTTSSMFIGFSHNEYLVSANEKVTEEGIGTDMTMHDHIKKLLDRFKDANTRSSPTNLGEALVMGYDVMGYKLWPESLFESYYGT